VHEGQAASGNGTAGAAHGEEDRTRHEERVLNGEATEPEVVRASDQEMNELLGRMITDDQFRTELMADPKTAVEKAGYELTSEQLAGLETPDMGELVGAVDERVSKRRAPLKLH
jgi:Ribosomally synthesized peptide prototyped by Frankia Franean1_4349.